VRVLFVRDKQNFLRGKVYFLKQKFYKKGSSHCFCCKKKESKKYKSVQNQPKFVGTYGL
jgi:hypothetical protein